MTDKVLPAWVEVLVEKWLDAAVWENDDLGHARSAQTFDQCAADLVAACPPQLLEDKEEALARMEKEVHLEIPLTATAMSDPPPISTPMGDAAEMLWVVLANVSGGNWKEQSQEWQDAAARWRDNYFAVLKRAALPGAVPAHWQLVRDTEEAFGIVQRILGFDVVGDDPDDWIIALRELEKRMAVGLGVMALPRVCASCDHLQSFELTDEIKTCPVLNIRIATQEIQTFGCSLYEPTALPGAVPAQEEPRYGSEVLCEACAKVFCPHGERGHFFHDGCPQCDGPETHAVPAQEP